MTEYVNLELACRCKQLSVAVEIPSSSLPMPLVLCHCNTCSQVSGQLCTTQVELPAGSKPLKITGQAKSYNTSPAIKRFFCETCGTNVYEDASGLPTPATYLVSGAFTRGEVELAGKSIPIARPDEHIFVGDTKDGGLRDWMTDIPSWEGWNTSSKEITTGSLYGTTDSTTQEDNSELRCACKCGGVKFTISRPGQGSGNWSDPTEAETVATSVPIEQTKDWWKPGDGAKYNAFLCACNDCRFSSGYEVSAFAVIPKNNFKVEIEVTPENVKELEGASTLEDHESSPGTHRQFCGHCGANLGFFTEQMPNVINVSVGLMQGRKGTRCEDWLEWQRNGIGHANLAQNKPFVDSLSSGYSRWCTARAGT